MASKNKAGRNMRLGVMIGILVCLGVVGGYLYPTYEAWCGLRAAKDDVMAIVNYASASLLFPTGSTEESVSHLLIDVGLITNREKFMSVAAKLNYDGGNVVPGF